MSALPNPRLLSADEYLMLEEQAEYRSQFYFGEIFAMAGANRRHNIIGMNIAANLHSQFRQQPCEVYQNDMRVKVSEEFYTYPDVVVVCGEPRIEPQRGGENLLNPTVLFEVLSSSTAQFDRNEKARLYRSLASLQELILVQQNDPHVEHYSRESNNSWLIHEITGLEAKLSLNSINCEINMADIYERINFNLNETA